MTARIRFDLRPKYPSSKAVGCMLIANICHVHTFNISQQWSENQRPAHQPHSSIGEPSKRTSSTQRVPYCLDAIWYIP